MSNPMNFENRAPFNPKTLKEFMVGGFYAAIGKTCLAPVGRCKLIL